jgi:hypothetical protein
MVPHALPQCTPRSTCQHFRRCRLRTLSPSPTISKHSPGRRRNSTSPWRPFRTRLPSRIMNILGRDFTTRPADAATTTILHLRYCLDAWTIDPDGHLGPLISSFIWPRKCHPLQSSLPCPLHSGLTPCSRSDQRRCLLRLQVPPEPRSPSES